MEAIQVGGGWLNIAALGHNGQMHTANGNLDQPFKCMRTNHALIENDKQLFWYGATIAQNDFAIDEEQSLRQTTRHIPKLYHCRSGHDSQAFTNAGTLHQRLCLAKECKVDMDRDTRMSEMNDLSQMLDWIGVGTNDTRWRVNESVLNLHNSSIAVDKVLHAVEDDYRPMALKIDLYDELREPRFLQPSGVEYAWASPDEYSSEIITLNQLYKWHYGAIFVSLQVFYDCLTTSGEIRVAGLSPWRINDSRVKIVGVRANPYPLALETWTIAHLTYPLAWTLDTFTMSMVGGEVDEEEIFVRTAGLVDIYDSADRIIFVQLDNTSSTITLADENFMVTPVQQMEGRQVPAIVFDINKCLENILQKMLKSPNSLREAFTQYCVPFFIGDIDWLEINAISVALTVRWHQRIESRLIVNEKNEKMKRSVGAPLDVLRMMGLEADLEVTKESYEAYGSSAAVNGMDQRFVEQEVARAYPAVKMGTWSNAAELAILTSSAHYETKNIENHLQLKMRMYSGGQDRMRRGQHLRKGFEAWKRSAAHTDRIAFPNAEPVMLSHWTEWTTGKRGDTAKNDNCTWFAGHFITTSVHWCWDMNAATLTIGCTLTGIRTISSWWRSELNTKWFKFGITCNERPCMSEYVLSNIRTEWTFNKYYQVGEGVDDPELDAVLKRLDLEKMVSLNWGLSYRTHPGCEEDFKLAWVVDSSYGGTLARELGWMEDEMPLPMMDVWGWGLHICVKDYNTAGKLKSLVIPKDTMSVISNCHYSDGTLLLCDLRDRVLLES